ncbi:nucleotidyltransferase domain-containing protein [Brevibacillus fluminis]|uniref:nucleotidyltransferase domain-containing protein n=1 Tax=Brevibacillus fluminis TaxID=511487 RepID=UPI003F8CAA3F
MSDMKTIIQNELRIIEQQENIRIIYACESGSRAWGFPSKDSDYDVRFLYARPVDWYLSIFDKRDVIERPISDLLDINGWDLKKALRLFKKSNPPLLEWLQSPIIYAESSSVAEQIRTAAVFAFSPKACMYHYLNMARGNFREYLQGEQVRIKKYFYVLRPLLACGWIEKHGSMPPMAFDELVDEMIPRENALYVMIQELLTRKKAGDELDFEPRLGLIHDFILERIAYFEQAANGLVTAPGNQDQALDEMFRGALREVWGGK